MPVWNGPPGGRMSVPRDEHGMLDLGKVSFSKFAGHYNEGIGYVVCLKNRDKPAHEPLSFAPICCERFIPAPPTVWQRISREEDPF